MNSGLMQIKGDGGWKGAIAFNVLWNLLTWPLAYVFIMHSNFGWPVFIFVSIFPLLGLFVVFITVRTFLANRRLGKPLLLLEQSGFPGKEPLEAKIQFYPPLGQRVDSAGILHPVKVSLVCVREDRRSEDTRETVIWEQIAVNTSYPRGTKELVMNIELPTSIPVEAKPDSKLVREYWQVVLEALGATITYKVPVNSESIARAGDPPFTQSTDMVGAGRGKAQSRRAVHIWVNLFGLLMMILMVWNFAGDLIKPYLSGYAENILAKLNVNNFAQTDHMQKPGKRVPILLDSQAGNGFGVVATVTGTIEIGDGVVWVFPESIELRSIFNCDPDCPYIRSVHFALTRDEGSFFSELTRSQDLPVGASLPDTGGQFVSLGEDQNKLYMSNRSKMDLADYRLTLGIDGEVKGQGNVHQASWYTHSDLLRYAQGEKRKPISPSWTAEGRQKQAREAVFEDRYDDLKLLLETGNNVNNRDERGETLLMQAAFRGNVNIISLLIRHKADVNIAKPVDKDGIGGETALHIAVGRDYIEIVRLLMDAGSRLNAVANQFWTPIHFAASSGAVKSMQYFHSIGVDVDQPFNGARRSTPIMLAAQFDKPEMIRLLIEMGVDAERKDLYGINACGYARHFNKTKAISVLGCN